MARRKSVNRRKKSANHRRSKRNKNRKRKTRIRKLKNGGSVGKSVGKPLFRVGLEIETCFKRTPLPIPHLPKEGRPCRGLHAPIEPEISFLESTHDGPDGSPSLFKGIREEIMCPTEDYCGIELVINDKRKIFCNGTELVELKDGSIQESVMDEFKDMVTDCVRNEITECAVDKHGISNCSVHIHISAPFLREMLVGNEGDKDNALNLFRILVFFLWFDGWDGGFQEQFKSMVNYVEVGKIYAPYVKKETLSFELPEKGIINGFLEDPGSNQQQIEEAVKKLPRRASTPHAIELSNLVLAETSDEINLYPRFEFRGHGDLLKSLNKGDVEEIYRHLITYINNIYGVLYMAEKTFRQWGIVQR